MKKESLLQKAVEEKYLFRPFSKEYSLIYKTQKRLLSKALKKIPDLIIEHVGSTSVKGLGGKAVVDILIFVPKKFLPIAKKRISSKAKYVYGGNWRKRRFFFSKYYLQKKSPRLVHVHLTAETREVKKLCAVVKYLRSNSKARKEYEKLKREASRKHWNNGEKYRKYKTKFLHALAKKALEENF